MESIIKVNIPTEVKYELPYGTITDHLSINERMDILDKLCNEVKAAFRQDNSIDNIYIKITRTHIPTTHNDEYDLPF